MKTSVYLVFLVVAYVETQIIPTSLCPPNSHGYVQSSSIILSSSVAGSNSIPNSQSQVYNYALGTPFLNTPAVIIGITSFQSTSSPYLMISIKPLPITSLASLSFLIRFYFKYTSWRLMTFSFLAEDRQDIDSNYFQIDTRQLATPQLGKAIQIQLPIETNISSFQALYFLNGYEIASVQTSNSFSPFEIQAIALSQSAQGLQLVISATTQTEVYSLVISYLIYDNTSTYFTSGTYQYSSLSTASYFSIGLNANLNPAFIFGGINGFILPNTQGSTQFSATFGNNSLEFQITPALNYLTFQYFILYEPQTSCFYCQNAPYLYLNSCLTVCPSNTQLIADQCISCSDNQIWNGSDCVSRCFGGRLWNSISQTCNCPASSSWSGSTCVFCPLGQIWQAATLRCDCPANQYWNSYTCVDIPTCTSNQIFDTVSFMCTCPSNTTWNGSSCTNCSTGFIWNSLTSTCICANGSYFNGYQCITCSGGMIFDSINSICVCPANTAWNGSTCVSSCKSPFVVSNGQCICPPGTVLNANNCTTSPVCPANAAWVNGMCQNISCAPGFIWNGSFCTQYLPNCPLNSYWNGQSCASFNIQCPNGSYWNGSYCLPTSANCTQGSYYLNGICIPFPQPCLPSYVWTGSSCLLVGISITCSEGQYYNGINCINANCSNGQIWNSSLVQCVCPSSTYWNGNSCVSCPEGQTYGSSGCNCISGYFLVEGTCYSLQQIYCTLVSNAQWNGQSCVCNPGFSAVGINCVCSGIIVGSVCNQCYNIPNSQYSNGTCQCNSGYYKSMGQCILYTNSTSNKKPPTCNPGTLLDYTYQICIPCSDGCLSCLTQSICLQCRPEYTYNWATYHCDQICGDGKRFTLPCDDGNNIAGDGCSADCKVQSDYTCFGGSPNSPDFCTKYLPQQIVLNLTGTTHLFGKIIANVRSNYLPSNITNPSSPCTELCQQILQATVNGYNSYTSIVTQYLVGSSGFSFSVEIDFQTQPIGIFTLSIGINPTIAQSYFPSVDASKIYSFTINPAFLALAQVSGPSSQIH